MLYFMYTKKIPSRMEKERNECRKIQSGHREGAAVETAEQSWQVRYFSRYAKVTVTRLPHKLPIWSKNSTPHRKKLIPSLFYVQLMQLDRVTWWWLWHQNIQTYSCFAWRLSALFRHPCMPSVERRPERDMLVFPVRREP